MEIAKVNQTKIMQSIWIEIEKIQSLRSVVDDRNGIIQKWVILCTFLTDGCWLHHKQTVNMEKHFSQCRIRYWYLWSIHKMCGSQYVMSDVNCLRRKNIIIHWIIPCDVT